MIASQVSNLTARAKSKWFKLKVSNCRQENHLDWQNLIKKLKQSKKETLMETIADGLALCKLKHDTSNEQENNIVIITKKKRGFIFSG